MNIYCSNVVNNPKNKIYQNLVEVTDLQSFRKAMQKDHMAVECFEGARQASSFIATNCIMLDVDNTHSDNPNNWVTPKDLHLAMGGFVSFYYVESKSHMKEKNGKAARPKFHAYFEIDSTTDKEYYQQLKKYICELFPYFDQNALDITRFFFGQLSPRCFYVEATNNETSIEKYVKAARSIPDREPYTPPNWVNEAEQKLEPAKTAKSDKPKQSKGAKFEVSPNKHIYIPNKGENIKDGERNTTLHVEAVKLLKRNGISDETKLAFWKRSQDCETPLPLAEIRTIWESACKFQKLIEQSDDYVLPDVYTKKEQEAKLILEETYAFLKPKSLDDASMAEVFYKLHSEDAMYVVGLGWHIWTGSHWQFSKLAVQNLYIDFTQFMMDIARLKIRELYYTLEKCKIEVEKIGRDVHKLPKEWSDEDRAIAKEFIEANKFAQFIKSARMSGKIKGVLELSQSCFEVDLDEVDAKWNLLYTPDGVWDLTKEGEIMAHAPSDYSTKVTKISASDDAEQMAIWKSFLNKIFAGDAQLIRYVQEACGMMMFGKVFTECLVIAYGSGKNGKSTLFNLIGQVLGIYTGYLSSDIFVNSMMRNIKPELAELKGKRLVITAELQEGAFLNSKAVKNICSTDDIGGERKYQDPIWFKPSHSTVMYTNHLPELGEVDEGILRRLKIIPFNTKIGDDVQKQNYADELFESCGGAVLKWLIEGARLIYGQEFKFSESVAIQEQKDEFENEASTCLAFIKERCVEDESAFEISKNLYTTYTFWCGETDSNGKHKPDNIQKFSKDLKSQGYMKKSKKVGGKSENVWLGIKMK
ncbi:MAG: hypothetical protein ATN35_00885 [Epulopiscium sp. Nele67-Bin004]|nr:MAG: hypothetical protein ATN35_00885 [Epulopiscium sp. Nele67-Bin004]